MQKRDRIKCIIRYICRFYDLRFVERHGQSSSTTELNENRTDSVSNVRNTFSVYEKVIKDFSKQNKLKRQTDTQKTQNYLLPSEIEFIDIYTPFRNNSIRINQREATIADDNLKP